MSAVGKQLNDLAKELAKAIHERVKASLEDIAKSEPGFYQDLSSVFVKEAAALGKLSAKEQP